MSDDENSKHNETEPELEPEPEPVPIVRAIVCDDDGVVRNVIVVNDPDSFDLGEGLHIHPVDDELVVQPGDIYDPEIGEVIGHAPDELLTVFAERLAVEQRLRDSYRELRSMIDDSSTDTAVLARTVASTVADLLVVLDRTS